MTDAHRHDSRVERAMEQIFERREEQTPDTAGLRYYVESWKNQAKATPAVVATTLPGVLIVAAVLWLLTGTNAVLGLVTVPYLGALVILISSTANIFTQFTVHWEEIPDLTTGQYRHTEDSNRQLLRVGLLSVAGLSFLSVVAVSLGILAWIMVGQFWPGIGMLAAVVVPFLVVWIEDILITRWEAGISFGGITMAEHLLSVFGSLSPRELASLDALSATAKLLVIAQVSGVRSR